MKKREHRISKVLPGSIAEELEIEPGDRLLSINGSEIEDVFDYRFLVNDEYLELLVQKANGEEWELEIEKDYNEELGIEFENGLMDEYRSCHNKCIFCFIDQMPKGMRETLYFKDDDSRLSFLQGNYVTLTNMSDHDIDRIIRYHLEPINVSFQTMNPELRCKMLHNRFAGDALKKVDQLYEAGIEMNGQIVLCKGVNDGKELEYSIQKMSEYIPYLKSVSVVPVGLSKYREGLYPFEPFTREDAIEVLAMIHKWQDKLYKEHGTHFIHAGDEWYLMADMPLPEEDNYDGYLQYENGVGMVRYLQDTFEEELASIAGDDRVKECSVICGTLIGGTMKTLMAKIEQKFPDVTIHVYPIVNEFFGERITVSGLLTGQDIIKQLKGKPLGEGLYLPENMLRIGEPVFLDDVTVEEMEKTLQVPLHIVKSSGQGLVQMMIQTSEKGNNDYE